MRVSRKTRVYSGLTPDSKQILLRKDGADYGVQEKEFLRRT